MEKKDCLIVKSNKVVNAISKYKYNTNELKVIAHLISNIKMEDSNFKTNSINIKKFFKESNINTKYIDELTDNLMSKPFFIVDEDGKKNKYNWFTKLSYDNASIEYEFHPDLKPFLLDLKGNFTKYYLSNVMKLRSSYSIQIYELLAQTRDKGGRTIHIDKLRAILNIPDSYQNKNIKQMLNKVKLDLETNTDIKFNFSFEKEGRSFHKINFKIEKNTSSKEVINSSKFNIIQDDIIINLEENKNEKVEDFIKDKFLPITIGKYKSN